MKVTYSLVTEHHDKCISIFDPQGNMINTVKGNLINARSVLLDPKSGSLYVVNSGADTVLKYSL